MTVTYNQVGLFHEFYFVPGKICNSFLQDKLMFSDNGGRKDGKYQSKF